MTFQGLGNERRNGFPVRGVMGCDNLDNSISARNESNRRSPCIHHEGLLGYGLPNLDDRK